MASHRVVGAVLVAAIASFHLAGARAGGAEVPGAESLLWASRVVQFGGAPGGICAVVGQPDAELETALSKQGSFVVHCLAPDPAACDGLRKAIRSRGLYGTVSADTLQGGRLPYQLGYTYDDLELGMSATFTKTISETDVYLFAGISGDFNPVHVDEEFAKLTPFGTRIAHGALPQSLIAPVLGMKLPGLGTLAVEVTARFKAPTFFGDTITARATVAEKLPKRRRVRMDCEWTNQRGEVVAVGSALVIPPPSRPHPVAGGP